MENKEKKTGPYVAFEQEAAFNNRRNIDRRKEPKRGFTYISTVGWVCRREQFRRKEDPAKF